MKDDSRPGKSGEAPLCSWCGAQLRNDEADNTRQPLCRRCVRLLMSAGLSDEEIFGDDALEN